MVCLSYYFGPMVATVNVSWWGVCEYCSPYVLWESRETVTGEALGDISSLLAFSDLIPARFFSTLNLIGGQAFSKYSFSNFSNFSNFIYIIWMADLLLKSWYTMVDTAKFHPFKLQNLVILFIITIQQHFPCCSDSHEPPPANPSPWLAWVGSLPCFLGDEWYVCCSFCLPHVSWTGSGVGEKRALFIGIEEKHLESFPTFTFFILSSLGPCYLGNFGINGNFLS